jgi:hypothetical protein
MDLDNWPWTEEEKKELEEIEKYIMSKPKMDVPPDYFFSKKLCGRRLTAEDMGKLAELDEQRRRILERE